jgi:uracil-DNA glycosylase
MTLSLTLVHFMEDKSLCPVMEASWAEKLSEEFQKPYMRSLEEFLRGEIKKSAIYPPIDQIFNAFCFSRFEEIKAVIIGQDPYHGEGQAHGLSFSVRKGVTPPPSLQNIFKELVQDCGIPMPKHGCLESWAQQGVMLLNATLTVRAGEAKSHYGRGWEQFTDRVVQLLAEREDPIVFLLWGRSAYEKWEHGAGQKKQHLLLTSAHPSPLAAHSGFFGCRHFSKANEFLKRIGKSPINWAI